MNNKTIFEIIQNSWEENTFLKLTLSKPKSKEYKKLFARKVTLKTGNMLQIVTQFPTKDITRNYDISEAIKVLEGEIGVKYKIANVFTTKCDYLALFSKRDTVTIKETAPILKSQNLSINHDKDKPSLVDLSKSFWTGLQITNTQHQILPQNQKKITQVNEFLKICDTNLSKLYGSCLPSEFSVIDMGCGRGYLSFALYDYLLTKNVNPNIVGVDTKKDLINNINQLSTDSHLKGLSFVNGSIDTFALPTKPLDMLIALHACNTATDDALWYGIQAKTKLIVCSPCCHQELYQKISTKDTGLSSILKYGILKDRQAEIVTDTLRLLSLQYHDYDANIMEFVGGEHSGKNLLIVAKKLTILRSKKQKSDILVQIQNLQQTFEIDNQTLATKILTYADNL